MQFIFYSYFPLGLDYFEKLPANEVDAQKPRAFRLGGLPKIGRNARYLSLSIWLNNNRLTNLEYLDK